jgi:hypothetical protein
MNDRIQLNIEKRPCHSSGFPIATYHAFQGVKSAPKTSQHLSFDLHMPQQYPTLKLITKRLSCIAVATPSQTRDPCICRTTITSPTTVAQSRVTLTVNNMPSSTLHFQPSFKMAVTTPSRRPVKIPCRCNVKLTTSILDRSRASTPQCHCRHAGLNRAVALLAKSVYTWKSPALLRHQ